MTKLHCSVTGAPIHNIGDAIWDDGEWVHWDHINGQIHEMDEANLLQRLIAIAREYFEFTDRHLPIYGEIGELYAQRRFGIERHRPCAEGSDGRIGDTFVEIKTITPAKRSDTVQVKRSGHFGALVIVRIDEDFRCDARLIPRASLPKGHGNVIDVRWAQYFDDPSDS